MPLPDTKQFVECTNEMVNNGSCISRDCTEGSCEGFGVEYSTEPESFVPSAGTARLPGKELV